LPGDFSKYRLVIYAALLIIIMLTRPQGVLGQRELGFSWLKRPQRQPEGGGTVGASKGVPIAQHGSAKTDHKKDIDDR
jgi:hypothetical protein